MTASALALCLSFHEGPKIFSQPAAKRPKKVNPLKNKKGRKRFSKPRDVFGLWRHEGVVWKGSCLVVILWMAPLSFIFFNSSVNNSVNGLPF